MHIHKLRQALTGTVDGTNATFTLPETPTAGTVRVFVNGIEQKVTADFTVSGATVTFVAAPRGSDGANPADSLFAHYEVEA